MEMKTGILCSPYYLLMAVGLWATICYAVPPPNGASPKGKRTVPIAVPGSSGSAGGSVHGAVTSTTTTIDPSIDTKGSRGSSAAISSTTPQRNKRDTSDTQAHFGMFPDARNADDALQKLLLLLTMTKPKPTFGMEDYDEDLDNPPIDLILGKEPGRSVRGMRPQSGKGEEPTGLPIVLYQHRMNKKSSPVKGVHELFLKDAANSSGYELDPRIIKLLDRMFNRQSRAKVSG